MKLQEALNIINEENYKSFIKYMSTSGTGDSQLLFTNPRLWASKRLNAARAELNNGGDFWEGSTKQRFAEQVSQVLNALPNGSSKEAKLKAFETYVNIAPEIENVKSKEQNFLNTTQHKLDQSKLPPHNKQQSSGFKSSILNKDRNERDADNRRNGTNDHVAVRIR